ncbi:MAG: tyrosine-type recombinase/integrase [Planctomycetes bacterium]|nr:tyrosine-type recombinase/integrase [Planctomycetota bacterium]
MATVYKRSYVTRDDGGHTVRRRCPTHTVKWRDDRGLHRIRAYSDKAASMELGRKVDLLVALRQRHDGPDAELTAWLAKLPEKVRADLTRHGVLDPRSLLRKEPIGRHVDDWSADLETCGRDDIYCEVATSRVRRLASDSGWKTLADVTADSFGAWRSARAGKLSARTLNHYFEALRAFLNWCRRQGRIDFNPVAGVVKVDQRGKEARRRRALTLDELDRLIAKTPLDRALLYKVTFYCQLRREDVKQLRWADVNLEILPPCLVTRAAVSKGRRETRHPLRADLADELRAFKPRWARLTDLVFPAGPPRVARGFRRDLEAAGIPYKDELGRQADFHSLGRQTPNTVMANTGVAPRIAQELMRHKDIRLTMGVYTDPVLLNKAAAVEGLPVIGKGKHLDREARTIKLNGTDGGPVDGDCVQNCDHAGVGTGKNQASDGTELTSDRGKGDANWRNRRGSRTPRKTRRSGVSVSSADVAEVPISGHSYSASGQGSSPSALSRPTLAIDISVTKPNRRGSLRTGGKINTG